MIHQFGGPEQLQINETAIPSIGSGEVLVRVHAAGVNPVDYKIRNGSMKFISGKKFPRIPGGDIAGVVEQAGEKSIYRPGDKVFAMLSIKGGGYAEFVAVNEKQLCHIPDGLGMAEAAATPLAALTALQALQKDKTVKSGDRILVNGASGGVGSFAVQTAKALGAYVVGVCSTRNTEFVRNLGADQVIDYNAGDFTKMKTRFNMVLDAVAKSSFSKCKGILTEDGSYVSTIPNNGLFLYQALNFTRKKKAFFIMTKPSGADLKFLSSYIAKGAIRPFVEKTFPLEDGAQAHKMIETERVRGKIVLSVI